MCGWRGGGYSFPSRSEKKSVISTAKSISSKLLPLPKILVLYSPTPCQACGSGTFQAPCSSFLHTLSRGCRFGMQVSFLLPSFPLVNSSQSNSGAWGGTNAGRGRVSSCPCGEVSPDNVGRIHLSGKSEVSPEHPILVACR